MKFREEPGGGLTENSQQRRRHQRWLGRGGSGTPVPGAPVVLRPGVSLLCKTSQKCLKEMEVERTLFKQGVLGVRSGRNPNCCAGYGPGRGHTGPSSSRDLPNYRHQLVPAGPTDAGGPGSCGSHSSSSHGGRHSFSGSRRLWPC